jgi:AcrR family transcriptional regulator
MGKGEQTRALVLDHAFDLASKVGFDGLSIGGLADRAGLSKSGLFGHFQSKEQLQLEVLDTAVERFMTHVIHPALRVPRGEPRVRAFFDNWLDWARGQAQASGGCVFIAAANELDDAGPSPLRDRLVEYQRKWLDGLARAAGLAVEEGHFRSDLDREQFAYEFYSIILAFHHASRLLRDARAGERARLQFERLVAYCQSGGRQSGDHQPADTTRPAA